MCYFPIENRAYDSEAFKKGLTHFGCGACPECLSSRANAWALRAVAEAKLHRDNCMVTLTYDNFARDERGNVIGELPVNRDLRVNKRDVQLFLKRLRKRLGVRFKYIAAAEYGSRTGRAHYHLVLFGVKFPDLVPYKKSKRNNMIYRSELLTSTWNHGICTVDSINVTPNVARYCTKYCSKMNGDAERDDIFMLFSHGLGMETLLSAFNGKSYVYEGHEYPIPKAVWQVKITEWYRGCLPAFDYHYIGRDDPRHRRNVRLRRNYRRYRDEDSIYKAYLAYWSEKARQLELQRGSVRDRIVSLDDRKWHKYKVAALKVLAYRANLPYGANYPAPNSHCISAYHHDREAWLRKMNLSSICPYPSCHVGANDTFSRHFPKLRKSQLKRIFGITAEKPPKVVNQLKFFDLLNLEVSNACV